MTRSKKAKHHNGGPPRRKPSSAKKGAKQESKSPRTPRTEEPTYAPAFTLREAAGLMDHRTDSWVTSSARSRFQAMTFVRSAEASPAEQNSDERGGGDDDAVTMTQNRCALQGLDGAASPKSGSDAGITNGTTSKRPQGMSKAVVSHGVSDASPESSDGEVIVFAGRQPAPSDTGVAGQQTSNNPTRDPSSWEPSVGPWRHGGWPRRLYKGEPTAALESEPYVGSKGQDNHDMKPLQNRPSVRNANTVLGNGNSKRRLEAESSITALLNDTVIDQEDHIGFDNPEAARAFDRKRAQKHARAREKARRGKRPMNKENDVPDEIQEDYIANLKANGEVEADSWEDEPSGQDQRPTDPLHGWDQSDIEALGEISTSEEVLGEPQAIVSTRDRPSGKQYLVIWEHQTMDEARWVPKASLTSYTAVNQISKFEEWRQTNFAPQQPSETNSDFSLGEEAGQMGFLSIDESSEHLSRLSSKESSPDDDELAARRIQQMTDEHIARLLSKQEELGMGSDEILLMDADEHDDDYDPSMWQPRATQGKRKKKKTVPRYRLSGSDIVLDTQAIDGLDAMGDTSPSSRRKNGGRTMPDFNLSDSSLERAVAGAWENDRQTKKAKKQEREALRAQGLLSSQKSNKPAPSNIAHKYRGGMTLDQMRNELAEFLDDDNQQTLGLPPLEKKDRKMVHSIAGLFGLRSKSAAKGKNRYPVLYKTARTRDFDERIFRRAEGMVSRGNFHYGMSGRGGGKGGGSAGASGRGGGANGLSYREGETVGAAAAELGAENRGHAMLQKMGWSKGMALGTTENQGILNPIEQVVKTSRSGLG